MGSVCTTEYYSAVKSKEMPTQATPQMDREDTALGEVGQTRKDEHCRIPRLGGSRGQRVDGGRGRQGLAEGDRELVLGGDTVSVWEGSGDRGWSWLHDSVSVLNATEPHTSRRFKWSIHGMRILPKLIIVII